MGLKRPSKKRVALVKCHADAPTGCLHMEHPHRTVGGMLALGQWKEKGRERKGRRALGKVRATTHTWLFLLWKEMR